MTADPSLFGELKRRKVVRVAGAYLVAAWIVLQVAATLLPILELPAWSVQLVAALLILGFPIALLLGWMFDLTLGGIERTAPVGEAVSAHFPIRVAVVGTAVVLMGVVGFLVVRRQLNAKGIDPNSVVVLPFRVTGDEKLAVMREGIVDLMAPKLTGVGGPRAVDSRTTLSAWRRTIKSEDDDLEPRAAIKLARKLGAAQVILGEVVGTPGEISLNARVYSTIDGVASDPARVRTTQDSLLSAVDLLITELLTRQAGEGDRLAVLLTESLPAVQAYLDGKRTFRLGHYEESANHFARALDIDSTFALAAWGEFNARGWVDYSPRYTRAVNLAFAFRDQLPPRERDMLIASFGDKYPDGQTYREAVRNMEQVSARYPDSPEVWYDLGDVYYHYGQPLGVQDFEDRALKAWSRAIELDSSFAGPWEHQLEVHVARGDTARTRATFAKLKQLKADNIEMQTAWLYAAATGNDTMRTRLLEEAPEWPRQNIYFAVFMVQQSGAPAADLDSLVAIEISSSKTDEERIDSNINAASYSLSRGRPQAAFKHLLTARSLGAERAYVINMLNSGIMYPREVPRDSVERHMHTLRASKDPGVACSVGIWEGLNARETEMKRALRIIADSLPAMKEARQQSMKTCAQMGKAMYVTITEPARARPELEQLDTAMLNGRVLDTPEAYDLATVVARAYTQIGEHERARQAAQRGIYTGRFRSAQFLELARAAARTGKREQAIRNYRIWLAFRDPEPGPGQELTDEVRAELAALTSR